MTTNIASNKGSENGGMEATFYDDESCKNHVDGGCETTRMTISMVPPRGKQQNINMFIEDKRERNATITELKKKMTLDFSAPPSKKAKVNSVLTSPDLNLLKLGSPELERMIIAQHGMITTTPTPGQILIFPKSVTEEQELYAKGFADALATLQPRDRATLQQTKQDSNMHTAYYSQSQSYNDLTMPTQVVKNSHRQINGTEELSSHPNPAVPHMVNIHHIKEEPQIVPCLGVGSSTPVSPVNMEQQEHIKLERKRLRNRVAASKCRRRKLDRIAKLEEKVAQLKGQNSSLYLIAGELRKQVCHLKEIIIDHRNNGCQIMANSSLGL